MNCLMRQLEMAQISGERRGESRSKAGVVRMFWSGGYCWYKNLSL